MCRWASDVPGLALSPPEGGGREEALKIPSAPREFAQVKEGCDGPASQKGLKFPPRKGRASLPLGRVSGGSGSLGWR